MKYDYDTSIQISIGCVCIFGFWLPQLRVSNICYFTQFVVFPFICIFNLLSWKISLVYKYSVATVAHIDNNKKVATVAHIANTNTVTTVAHIDNTNTVATVTHWQY